MTRRYTVEEVEEIRFYQLPKTIIENEKYRDLLDGAKITYCILRDRQDLSIKNNWLDDNGNVFCYFDASKLAELQNKSRTTVTKYKKLLIHYGLLEEKRLGQGKPNMLYILKPETLDMTLMSNSCTSRSTKVGHLDAQKLVTNDTEFKDTEKKDTNNGIAKDNSRYTKDSITFQQYLNIDDTNMTDESYELIKAYYLINGEQRYTEEVFDTVNYNINKVVAEYYIDIDLEIAIDIVKAYKKCKFKKHSLLHLTGGDILIHRLQEIGVLSQI